MTLPEVERILACGAAPRHARALDEALRRRGWHVAACSAIDASELADALAAHDWSLVLVQPSDALPSGLVLEQVRARDARVPILIAPEPGHPEPRRSEADLDPEPSARLVARELRRRRRATWQQRLERLGDPLVERLELPVAVVDADGRVVAASAAFGRLEAELPEPDGGGPFALDALLGPEPSALPSPDGRSRPVPGLQARLRAGDEAGFELELPLCHRPSQHVRLRVRPLRSTELPGPAPHRIVLLSETGHVVQVERQLRAQQRLEAVGRVAAGVAHDVNNMLAVVQSAATILGDDDLSGEDRREILDEVWAATDRSAKVVRHLLAYARRGYTQPIALDLGALVAGAQPLLERHVGSRGRLEIALPAAPLVVRADWSQIEQVLMNLVFNAVDAAGDRAPEVAVRLQSEALDESYGEDKPAEVPPGEYACLTVSDRGEGIAAEHRPHLFEPFFTTRGERGGTGLGLSTVYGVVKATGGFVWVYSEPGRGTTIKVYLPLAGGVPEQPPRPPSRPPRARPGERVLVVEDRGSVRRSTSRALREAGYEAVEVGSLAEARARLETAPPPHLVLTDFGLPDGTGVELIDWVRGRRPAIAVCLATGLVPAGLDCPHLEKPYSGDALLEVVRRSLDAGARSGPG